MESLFVPCGNHFAWDVGDKHSDVSFALNDGVVFSDEQVLAGSFQPGLSFQSASSPSLTITDPLTVAQDKTLTLQADDIFDTGILMSGSLSAAATTNPSIYNHGSIVGTSSIDGGEFDLIGADQGTSPTEKPVIKNYGLISSTATNQSFATAVFGGSWCATVDNFKGGTIVAKGGVAQAIVNYDPAAIIDNAGEISAVSTNPSATLSAAISLYNSGHLIVNSGTISVHSADASGLTAAICAGDLNFVVLNSGKIEAAADENYSETRGIYSAWLDSDSPTVIQNSGDISAGWAIDETQAAESGPVYGPVTFVNNIGTIEGNIFVGFCDDFVINRGTITGNVDLGGDEDIYDGRGGRISGTVNGGSGDDFLQAGSKGDKFLGGGNDTFVSGAGSDNFNGGSGADTASYFEATASVRVDLSLTGAQKVGGGMGQDTLVQVENLAGSEFGDSLTGDSNANTLTGGGGNDKLTGGGGDDVLNGDWPTETSVTSSAIASTSSAGSIGNGASYGATISADGTKVLFQSRSSIFLQGNLDQSDHVYIKDLAAGALTQVDTKADGTSATAGGGAFLSPDGTMVAFTTADALVSKDTNGNFDVYIKNLSDGSIERVSTDKNGKQAEGATEVFGFSPDGKQVILQSDADNLKTGVPTGQIYLKNLETGALTVVSCDVHGAAGNWSSTEPVMSADGTKVLFTSKATNLDPAHYDPTHYTAYLYVKDLTTGVVTTVGPFGSGTSSDLESKYAISPDGTEVVFTSASKTLVPHASNGIANVYIDNLATGTISLVSDNAQGAESKSYCDSPVFSPDGRYVAFYGASGSGLTTSHTSKFGDIYVKDLVTGTIQILALPANIIASATAWEYPTGTNTEPFSFSADGKNLVIQSGAYTSQIYILHLAQSADNGNDTLQGGAGDDTLNGGGGSDTATYADASGAVHVSLAILGPQYIGGGEGSDTLASIENLIGSSFNDSLIGDSGNNALSGGAGNDSIIAAAGLDMVNGGDGDDSIIFASFLTTADRIDGGVGNDTVLIFGDYSAGLTFSSTTMIHVETLKLGSGFDYRLKMNNATVASGTTLTVDASALGAANHLTFNGSAETDGHFKIVGGLGADNLTGGALSDTFVYLTAAQSGGAQYDTIHNINFALDNLDVGGAITAVDALVHASLSTASFDADLTAAVSGHLIAGSAMLVGANAGSLNNQAFLVVDQNGIAGYQSGEDLVIRLAGHSGTLATSDFI